MKMKFILALLLCTVSMSLTSQVTIGSAGIPSPGALLQLKDDATHATLGVNATKGLGLPRVDLVEEASLLPMFQGDNDYIGNIGNKKTIEDTNHAGLTVFNTNDSYPFCKGVYFWDGTLWQPIIPCTPVYRRNITIMGYGDSRYNIAHEAQVSGSWMFSSSSKNFGLDSDSKVKSVPFTYKKAGSASTANLANDIATHKPQIIVIGYPFSITNQHAIDLRNFMANKGIVLMFTEDVNNVKRALEGILQITLAVTNMYGVGAVYSLSNVDDPVLVGTFGDARGKQWGEDASSTVGAAGIPANDIIPFSYGKNISTGVNTYPTHVNAFRHKTKRFVFFGDGGFFSFYDLNYNDAQPTAYPFKMNNATEKKPVPKPAYGAGSTKFDVYNSIVFANAFVWALRLANTDPIVYP